MRQTVDPGILRGGVGVTPDMRVVAVSERNPPSVRMSIEAAMPRQDRQ